MKLLHSIRAKLTIAYTLLVGVTLLGFGVTSYYYTQEKLFASLDYSLSNEVIWLKDFIEPKAKRVRLKKQKLPAPIPPQMRDESKKVRRKNEIEVAQEDSTAVFDQIWNQIYEHTLLSPKKQIIQIRDRNGDILYKSYSLGKEDISFEDIPYNITKLVTVFDSKGQSLRLAVTQNAYAKIYVAYPEAEVTEVLSNLFSIFILLVPAALALSVLGGWFLASRSLRPVDNVTRAARAITAQNLDKRIDHTGVDDELGRLVSTFNEMIGRLQSSFQQIRQFSADASHELRTPLTIMRGEVELALRSKQTTEEYRRVLASALDEILRMTSIIESLLTLAKGDLNPVAPMREDIKLRPVIHELYEDSTMLAQSRQIIMLLGTVDEATVTADPIRIRQMVLNLLDNAIKYTPPGGTVGLSMRRQAATVTIVVEDTGFGIPEEHQEKIFDRFYRVDKGRSREMGGTGLGLAIVKWIAETHGGTVTLQSEPGKGSVFSVILPLAGLKDA
ncbi:MAG: ATP-binding protein [Ignavibacteriales bacterium]|nr:ATP-binding protein [Ignavibacteriales bacterium]